MSRGGGLDGALRVGATAEDHEGNSDHDGSNHRDDADRKATAVIVLGGADALRGTLADVYATLDLPLDIETVGAVADRHPEVDCDFAQRTIIDEAVAEYEMVSPR